MPGRPRKIVYPGNVPEIDSSLSTNELVRRLKLLVETLRDIDQDSKEALKYNFLAIHLAGDFFTQNESKDVRIYAAIAIADILRIFAPDSPYGDDPDLLKSVLIFLIKQLRGLAKPDDPLFNQYYLLLEVCANLAIVKTLNIVLELEESQEIIGYIFKLLFNILSDEGTAEKVQGLMVDIMTHIIRDAQELTVKVLDILLQNLLEPYKTQNRDAYKCAKEVINLCSTYIRPSLEYYLLTGISDTQTTESELTEHMFEIIFEVYKIIPEIIGLILGQLEDKLTSSEIKDRLALTRLLAKLFGDKDSTAYEECPSLWSMFLARFNDAAAEVRLQCVTSSADLLINQPKVRDDLTKALCSSCIDMNENVRLETMSIMLSVVKRNVSLITDDFLSSVKLRILDKKFKVRKEAALFLGTVYRKIVLNAESSIDACKNVSWIKNKLLHIYYQTDLDDKILCEKLLNTCLVPFVLETEKRMDVLYELYCTIDDHAAKAFNEILRQQHSIRHIMKQIFTYSVQESESDDFEEMQLRRLKQLSEFFIDPQAFEHMRGFYDFLVEDPYALKLIRYIMVADNYTTKKVEDAVKELLMKVGPQTKYKDLHLTVRGLLERSAPVMIDKSAIKYLTEKVRQNLLGQRTPFAVDIVNDEQIVSRGFELLMVLSSAYSSAFFSEETLNILLVYIGEGNPIAADAAIQIFHKIGRPASTQNNEEYANVFGSLLPELKTISKSGSPKQAKHAIQCIVKLWPQQDSILDEILNSVKDEVNLTNAYIQTVFASLSAMALARPEEFRAKLKSIVSTSVVKNILLNDQNHANMSDKGKKWGDATELSHEAKAKISAIKFMVRRLLGMKSNDDNHASNTLKLLHRIIETDGNIQSVKMSSFDKAHIKLAAACGFLKLLQDKLFSQLLTLEQYRALCFVILDDCPQVRQKFASKLHKGLTCLQLPLHLMASYALVPLLKTEDEKSFRQKVVESIASNYRRRKDYLRKHPNLQNFQWKYMPEYYLSFVVYLLSYHPDYEHHDDCKILRDLRECLWFSIEPMLEQQGEDAANCVFLYKILQTIKHTMDAEDPENEDQNIKMWTLCDLAMTLINYRTPKFQYNNTQVAAVLSKRFFYKPPKGTMTTNTKVYLPAEIIDEERRSGGGNKRTKKEPKKETLKRVKKEIA